MNNTKLDFTTGNDTNAAQQGLCTYYYATVVCVIFRLRFSELSYHSAAAKLVLKNTF